MSGYQAWVTLAKDDDSAWNALILEKSLRRVKTNRKIIALIGPSVSSEMRKLLGNNFDGSFGLNKGLGEGLGSNLDILAKVQTFGLTLLEKCVFLDANSLVLRNSDELFENFDVGAPRRDGNDVVNAVILITPGVNSYEELMLKVASKRDADVEMIVFEHLAQQKNFGWLDSKFDYLVDLKDRSGENSNYATVDAHIIHFSGKSPLHYILDGSFTGRIHNATDGTLENIVLRFSEELYSEAYKEWESFSLKNNIIQAKKRPQSEPIAIVGMACRLPGANNLEEFWQLLINKKDGISNPPENRWTTEQNGEVDAKLREMKAGFLKCSVDDFDGKFFGMSPMELSFTDPQQRLLLEVVWEALENAAINPLVLPNTKTGIFTGTWTNDYRDLLTNSGMLEAEFFRSYMGNAYGASAGRLAHFLGIMGPNIATESGCSSSIVAVGLGMRSLQRGESNLALACGVNLLLHPFQYDTMQSVISPDGHCKPFDEKADGFGRAEGCGVLVLKRLSDAIRDNDRIHAVIRGYGQTQEGPSRSMGTPTVQCESIAMKMALADAGVEPLEVDYVEAHGTGTAVGDPLELESISVAYSGERETPLIVGSCKANVGHTESCSGVTGIIKTVLSIQNEMIPGQIYLDTLNPRINLDKIPAIIPTEATPWNNQVGKHRLAGVSSFGITGTDAHVIIEEPPKIAKIGREANLPGHILAISAKSEEALEDLLQSYVKYLQKEEHPIGDIAYTANTGRAHFASYRAAIVAEDGNDFVKKLEKRSLTKKQVSGEMPKVCFLFTGQGSQFHGMGATLYKNSQIFKKNFDLCDSILQRLYNISIRTVLWAKEETDQLHRTLFSQTSIFCIEYCLLKVWESWGVKPDMVVGHSLGEFAAAVASGILTLESALKLVGERSNLIDKLPGGKMIVIKANEDTTKQLLKTAGNARKYTLDFAAVNSPDQTVLAGPVACIDNFARFCDNNRIKTHVLKATHAFHSESMDPMLPSYSRFAQGLTYNPPKCIYISGMDGKQEIYCSSEYWVRHTRESVQFLEATKAAYNQGARMFIEIGPQPILSALITRNIEEIPNAEIVLCLPSIKRRENEWTTLLDSLAQMYTSGFDVNWDAFYKNTNYSKVNLPTYPFQRKKHWFERKDKGRNTLVGKPLHPLVGCSFKNASSTKIYQNLFTLDNMKYVRDHAVGKYVIMPGAAFLEMSLAAGHASTLASFEDFYPPTTPVVVRNLSIESPLSLEEGSYEIQTIVAESGAVEEEIGWNKITIYQQLTEASGASKWIRHATSKFSCIVSNVDTTNCDIETLKGDMSNVGEDMSSFYDQLKAVGLNFGPLFQSLKKVWHKANEGILVEVQVPDDAEGYLCHPVVIDALIQSFMVDLEQSKPIVLSVPVIIEEFIWIAKSDCKVNYIHVSTASSSGKVANLYDARGQKLAIIKGVQLIETSLESIGRSLDGQKLSLPKMFEEVWRLEHCNPPVPLDGKILATYKEGMAIKLHHDDDTDNHDELVGPINELITLHIMKTFQELGIRTDVGSVLELNRITTELKIPPVKKHFLRRCFEILREDGYLSAETETMWKVVKFPSLSDLNTLIHSNISRGTKSVERDLVLPCLEKLTLVLQGKETVLPILFPERKTEVSAEAFYEKGFSCKQTNLVSQKTFEYLLKNGLKSASEGRELKIIEVGAGTGGLTKIMLPLLEKHGIAYKYTYTDVSSVFFIKAQNVFEKYERNMEYKVLNIEQDPKIQGFKPNDYDVLLASHVLHAVVDMTECIMNSRHLLRKGGLIMVAEAFEPYRIIDAIFGMVDGYWRYTDFNLRPWHCLISEQQWMNLFLANGFGNATTVTGTWGKSGVVVGEVTHESEHVKYISPALSNPKVWLIFCCNDQIDHQLTKTLRNVDRDVIQVLSSGQYSWTRNSIGETVATVRPNVKADFKNILETILSSSQNTRIEGIVFCWGLKRDALEQQFAQGFLYLLQTVLEAKLKTPPKIFAITQGLAYISDQNPVSPSNGSLIGLIKSFKSENFNIICKCIDIDLEADSYSTSELIFNKLWDADSEHITALRENSSYVQRMTLLGNLSKSDLTLPNCQRYELILPKSKSIGDLRFAPSFKKELAGHAIEVQVKTAGLNFKDVLNVLKPDAQFDNSNSVGADFAGVITAIGPDVTDRKVGDAVIGCNFESGALPSHLRTLEDAVVSLPSYMTFADGATLPAVFATAYHCLVDVAQLKRHETVLIHTASGGVGLIAIQIAQEIGATIIVTAGNKRKRAYLKSLGIEHVFHSRNLSFGEEIENVTNGRGVDVVINSLTSPGFKETTLQSCAQNARFIEMSKLNIWQPEEVIQLRSDVLYTIVDLTAVSVETWKTLFSHLNRFLNDKKLQVIPYTRFDAKNIRDALTYLQKAKHIGKVVCVMPECVMSNGEVNYKNNLFNERSTYLITGGLGGIGLEAAKWMVDLGAKHIILCGRSQPNENANLTIENLRNNNDALIRVVNADVGSYEDCERLLSSIQEGNEPPLRGIMHAAGCLSDGTIPSQTWEKFETTFNAKVKGSWNLHSLTIKYDLEHFVLYSSAAAVFGSIGQCNHAAGNAFLDHLAHYRHALGLNATSVNWGQWGQVGVAADLDIPGFRPMTTIQAFNALETIMRANKVQAAAIEVDVETVKLIFPWAKHYMEEIKTHSTSREDFKKIDMNTLSEEFCQEFDSADGSHQPEVVQKYLSNLISRILRLDAGEKIEQNQTFQDLGLDSLMMVELKNILQAMVGNRATITVTALSDCNTISLLSKKLTDIINGVEDIGMPKEQFVQLLREDSTLSPHIQVTSPSVKLQDVKCILLTGVTGNLAPYILKNLSLNDQIKKIYCLVRPGSKGQGSVNDRVNQNLKEKDLLGQIAISKVQIIEGNLSDESMGLSQTLYDKLASEIDAVFHCAVKSNHLELYRKNINSSSDLRTVNVIGTIRILEFATKSKTKWVFHASTHLAVTKAGKDGYFPEEWPHEDEFDDVASAGYPTSKFICDRLISQAVDQGLPCKVFRFPYISGDSKTGKGPVTDNHIFLRFLHYMQSGKMPSIPMPLQIVPVDVCADVSVQVFFDEKAPVGIFNVNNPHNMVEQDFAKLSQEFGYPVEVVEFEEYVTMIEGEGASSILFPVKEIYTDPKRYIEIVQRTHSFIESWLQNPDQYYQCRKIPLMAKMVENPMEILRRDIQYAKDHGFFEKLGL